MWVEAKDLCSVFTLRFVYFGMYMVCIYKKFIDQKIQREKFMKVKIFLLPSILFPQSAPQFKIVIGFSLYAYRRMYM